MRRKISAAVSAALMFLGLGFSRCLQRQPLNLLVQQLAYGVIFIIKVSAMTTGFPLRIHAKEWAFGGLRGNRLFAWP